MTRRSLVAILFIAISIAGFAQTSENAPEDFHHDLGISTAIVLQGVISSGSTPFALLYKKYSAEDKAPICSAILKIIIPRQCREFGRFS